MLVLLYDLGLDTMGESVSKESQAGLWDRTN